MNRLFTKNKLITFVSVLLLLLLWKLASWLMGSDLILPSPEKTIATTLSLLIREEFISAVGYTVLRGLTGFALSLVLAVGLGIWAGTVPAVHAAIKPVLVTLRSTPVISFILLALIWFRVEQVPVFIAFLTMFPIVCTNVIEGIRSLDGDLLEMAEFFRVPRKRIIRELYIPGIAPFLTSGISTAIGFGWRAVIIGEVLSQPGLGIGTQMQQAQTYLMVSELIAWTVIAVLISYFFEWLITQAESRLIQWKAS